MPGPADNFATTHVDSYGYLSEYYPHQLPQHAAEFRNIRQLTAAVRSSGSHFFDPETMRMFNNKLQPDLHGNRFFITTETPEPYSPYRADKHVVRWVAPRGPHQAPDSMLVVGRFKENHPTLGDARAFAQHAATLLPSSTGGRKDGIPPLPVTHLGSTARPVHMATARIAEPTRHVR